MEKTFEKSGDSIKVTTTKTTISESIYDLPYLKAQLAAIRSQKERDNNQRDIEIAEVEELINEAERLGIAEQEDIIE